MPGASDVKTKMFAKNGDWFAQNCPKDVDKGVVKKIQAKIKACSAVCDDKGEIDKKKMKKVNEKKRMAAARDFEDLSKLVNAASARAAKGPPSSAAFLKACQNVPSIKKPHRKDVFKEGFEM